MRFSRTRLKSAATISMISIWLVPMAGHAKPRDSMPTPERLELLVRRTMPEGVTCQVDNVNLRLFCSERDERWVFSGRMLSEERRLGFESALINSVAVSTFQRDIFGPALEKYWYRLFAELGVPREMIEFCETYPGVERDTETVIHLSPGVTFSCGVENVSENVFLFKSTVWFHQ